jgi:hypothetical protein
MPWVTSRATCSSRAVSSSSGVAGATGAPARRGRGDYNADGIADITTWRPSDGRWRVAYQFDEPFGRHADKPV